MASAGFRWGEVSNRLAYRLLAAGPISLVWTIALLMSSLATADEYLPTLPLTDFAAAKYVARNTIYRDHLETLYCACSFLPTKTRSGGAIDVERCGYAVRRNEKLGKQLQWDHVVPANTFKRLFACGHTGGSGCKAPGRKCCQDTSSEFNHLEADLHNLVPAVGEVNASKGKKPMGLVEGEPREYGSCDFESGSVVEPAEHIRGDLARIWLYMHEIRGVPLSRREIEMYIKWHRLDPPDTWEIERDRRIQGIQGNSNPYVSVWGFAD